ncbi:phosphoribosylformylglycinamidine synthase subunit PurQ [Proteinivorax hydrogeniformans]|uniref:Phosphoribosylformylglycinamidine synthase subunit PurQ n=1 Tax=Proteinivorax hydrogeniformans TaxID=1826727 RepID=A0AAU8HS34_9FIRM
MNFGVVVFPGSNCDKDAQYAVESLGHSCQLIWHKDTDLPKDVDCIILPGGFSYGDYLRSGAIARFSPIMEAVKKFAEDDGIVVGICNGFQILVESGLLPGALMKNKSTKFICKEQSLKVVNNKTVFTNQYQQDESISLPIAHGDGNYYVPESKYEEIKKNNQILFTYNDNPNGSSYGIAGVKNEKGNVMGMMPHPERAVDSILGGEDGVKIFQSIISHHQGRGQQNG